ncbi:MAG: RNA methyltransferase [Chlorobiales bacterium]|nr:RNA methyltransferase [Chlorobiales bacterium]
MPHLSQPLSKAMLTRFSKLGQRKYRDQEGLFIAEGLRTVRELIDSLPEPEMLVALIFDEGAYESMRWFSGFRGKIFRADRDAFARLAQTTNSQGVLGVFRKQVAERFVPGTRSLIVALDDVQDPGNVGTIIRTAAWFGADAVICGEGTADLYNAKAVRSSAGSIYAVRYHPVKDLAAELEWLQGEGFMVAAASLDGQDYRSYGQWPERRILVIGNEANGIGQPVLDLADRLVLIPHAGDRPNVESLNASVSAAILLAGLSFV